MHRIRYVWILIFVILISSMFLYNEEIKETLYKFEDTGISGHILFTLVGMVLVSLLFPFTIYVVITGSLYSIFVSFIILSIVGFLSASLLFFLSRKLFSEMIYSSKNPYLKKTRDIVKKHLHHKGFACTLFMRIISIPYVPLSMIMGIFKEIRYIDFISAMMFANIFYFLIVLLFEKALLSSPIYILYFIPVLLVLFYLYKRFQKHFQERIAKK